MLVGACARRVRPHGLPGEPSRRSLLLAACLGTRYAGAISRLMILACLPTCRPRVNPYCSNSSTVVAEEEPILSITTGGHFGDRLNEAVQPVGHVHRGDGRDVAVVEVGDELADQQQHEDQPGRGRRTS